MNILEKEIRWGEEQLILTNQRVLYWASQRTLILSDLHVGKAAHFRKNGIPIPGQIHRRDLERLGYLLNWYQVQRVIVVGDLLHASDNSEVQDFKSFLLTFAGIEFVLVRGNHDRLSESRLLEIGLASVCAHYQLHHILFVHEPLASFDGYQMSGHIHPGASFRLPTNQFIRLPTYAVGEKQLILPAFSHFTGLNTSCQQEGMTCFAFYEDGFFEVK